MWYTAYYCPEVTGDQFFSHFFFLFFSSHTVFKCPDCHLTCSNILLIWSSVILFMLFISKVSFGLLHIFHFSLHMFVFPSILLGTFKTFLGYFCPICYSELFSYWLIFPWLLVIFSCIFTWPLIFGWRLDIMNLDSIVFFSSKNAEFCPVSS